MKNCTLSIILLIAFSFSVQGQSHPIQIPLEPLEQSDTIWVETYGKEFIEFLTQSELDRINELHSQHDGEFYQFVNFISFYNKVLRLDAHDNLTFAINVLGMRGYVATIDPTRSHLNTAEHRWIIKRNFGIVDIYEYFLEREVIIESHDRSKMSKREQKKLSDEVGDLYNQSFSYALFDAHNDTSYQIMNSLSEVIGTVNRCLHIWSSPLVSDWVADDNELSSKENELGSALFYIQGTEEFYDNPNLEWATVSQSVRNSNFSGWGSSSSGSQGRMNFGQFLLGLIFPVWIVLRNA